MAGNYCVVAAVCSSTCPALHMTLSQPLGSISVSISSVRDPLYLAGKGVYALRWRVLTVDVLQGLLLVTFEKESALSHVHRL